MKKLLILGSILLCSTLLHAQESQPSAYQVRKADLLNQLPVERNDIVFLGNSITDYGEWAELFGNRHIKNRGNSGDRTYQLLRRLDPIVKGQPRKIFLMIGTNDLGEDKSPEYVLGNIRKIVSRIRQESPRTRLYIQSILPVNNHFTEFAHRHGRKDAEIVKLNKLLQKMCSEGGIPYIDLHQHFVDSEGKLDARYTNDGLHLMGAGYLLWKELIKQYVK